MKAIQTDGTAPVFGSTSRPFSPHQVWVKVAYAGLCRTDILCGKGLLNVAPQRIIGHECAGLVVHSPNSRLPRGSRVCINPLLICGQCAGCQCGQSCSQPCFLGLDADGAFAEFIAVPETAVHVIPNRLSLQQAAFVEPVAAALAVLDTGIESSMNGLVIGQGRIAQLVCDILALHGFKNVRVIDKPKPELRVDFVVECTGQGDLEPVLQLLKPKGVCILKSRRLAQVNFPLSLIVSQELQIKGAYYASFASAIDLLNSGRLETCRYFGAVYPLEHFVPQFNADESLKIFCQPHAEPERI